VLRSCFHSWMKHENEEKEKTRNNWNIIFTVQSYFRKEITPWPHVGNYINYHFSLLKSENMVGCQHWRLTRRNNYLYIIDEFRLKLLEWFQIKEQLKDIKHLDNHYVVQFQTSFVKNEIWWQILQMRATMFKLMAPILLTGPLLLAGVHSLGRDIN